MAIFGRNTARQRLRRATRESLTIPAFSSPVDCTSWVTGGLWPAELSTVTAETATVAEYLRNDLQRIAQSANEELRNIRQAGMADSARQAEESRVINGARAFAVRRVESTVRHLRGEARISRQEYPRVNGAEDIDETAEQSAVTAPPDDAPQEREEIGRREAITADEDDRPPAPLESPQPAAEPEAVEADRSAPASPSAVPEAPETEAPPREPSQTEVPQPGTPERAATDLPVTSDAEDVPPEPQSERLRRLLQFVARQEPGLRWAVGLHEDDTTVLVTDLAHGWIPSGITLPAGVRLLEPQRRSGNAAALLGPTTQSAKYAPGDSLGWSTDFGATESSLRPRELPAVDDLGWVLGEATHWRDGLPRLVYTLAKAGAAGTGVVDAELDVLRVHLDTARYQLLAQYPDVDAALLLNCLLLAATEGIATGDRVSANYHFAWFQMLSAPPASRWAQNPAPGMN